jgi:hypothetical protein
MAELVMPALSPTMEKGALAKWRATSNRNPGRLHPGMVGEH